MKRNSAGKKKEEEKKIVEKKEEKNKQVQKKNKIEEKKIMTSGSMCSHRKVFITCVDCGHDQQYEVDSGSGSSSSRSSRVAEGKMIILKPCGGASSCKTSDDVICIEDGVKSED